MVPDDDGKEVVYHSCPQKFVSPVIWEFLEVLDHEEKYPHTVKPFHDQDKRFLAFKRYYRNKFAEYSNLVKREG